MTAVLAGWLTGLIGLMAAVVVLAVAIWQLPLEMGTEVSLALTLGAVAALAGGLQSGRRSGESGLMHGALTGLLLVLAQGGLAAIWSGMPAGGYWVWVAALGVGTAALGGVIGVNLSR